MVGNLTLVFGSRKRTAASCSKVHLLQWWLQHCAESTAHVCEFHKFRVTIKTRPYISLSDYPACSEVIKHQYLTLVVRMDVRQRAHQPPRVGVTNGISRCNVITEFHTWIPYSSLLLTKNSNNIIVTLTYTQIMRYCPTLVSFSSCVMGQRLVFNLFSTLSS